MCDTNTKQHKNWNCSSSAFFQMVKAAVTAQQSASTAKQIPHHGSRLASHFQEPTLQCRFVPFQQTPFGDSTGGQDTMPGSTQPSTSCCTKARQRHAPWQRKNRGHAAIVSTQSCHCEAGSRAGWIHPVHPDLPWKPPCVGINICYCTEVRNTSRPTAVPRA